MAADDDASGANPPLLTSRHEGIVVLTLNRPGVLNALSRALRRDLIDALRNADRDAAVRAVILTGAGRAFCVGLDLKEMAQAGGSVDEEVAAENVVEALAAMSKPVIGAINGLTITGGLEIALACDLLVASDDAEFADTHVRVGLAPGWGLSQRLSRIVGLPRAKEMSLSGRWIAAPLAHDWGLVNHVVAAAELLPFACALALEMAANDPGEVARMKALVDRGFDMPLDQALIFEAKQAGERNSQTAGSAMSAPSPKSVPSAKAEDRP